MCSICVKLKKEGTNFKEKKGNVRYMAGSGGRKDDSHLCQVDKKTNQETRSHMPI